MSVTVLAHLDHMKSRLRSIPSPAAFTFGVACLEREWPVYVRASEGKSWEARALLRMTLDAIWDWRGERRNRPDSFANKCESAINDKGPMDNCDSYGAEITTNFFAFASYVEE